MLTGRSAARRRHQQAEDGFTLIELIVTIAIISAVLLGLLAVQTSALSTVTLSRERQQATDLANRTMEQLRALPYDIVAGGLLNTDASPASDSSIQSDGTSLRYKPAHKPSIDEVLVTRSASNCPQTSTLVADDCPPVPLYPHVQTGPDAKIGKVQFRVASYVTLVSATPTDTSLGYWLTVDVTWSSVHSHGKTTRVSTRSQVFSPSGCLSTATHPFSGPCQAYFESSAGSTPAGISITADTSGDVLLPGNGLQQGSVSLPSLSTVVQSEQIVSAQSSSTAPQMLSTPVGSGTPSGGAAATTGATTDPATGEATAPADQVVPQSSHTSDFSGLDSAFALSYGASEAGASSTTSATASTGCKTVTGADITSTQACSSGRTSLSGAVEASLTYGAQIPLASIAAPSDPSRALAARFTTAGGAHCVTTSAVGCIVADSARSVGAALVGQAPAGATRPDGTLLPTGFAMVSVTPHTATATAESGLGAAAPTASRLGQVDYSGGTIDLSGPAPATPVALQPVSFTYPGPGGVPVDVVMSGNLTVQEKVVPPPSAGPCQPDVCAVDVSSGGVLASVTYELSSGGSPVTRFTVTVDLGAATARTSFRGTP